MWLTLFWHVGTGLPWAWRTGPSDSSERQHLQEMLAELPENTLIAADAGFVGYEFWRAVMEAGHSFVIRAGANVRLLKKLGYAREYDQTIYLWPNAVAKKELPPLVLRAVWVHDGKQPMCLVTNVLSKTQSERSADRGHLQSALGRGSYFSELSSRPSGVASFAAMRRRMLSWKSTGRWWGCGAFVCWRSESWFKQATIRAN